jgi:type I restriction enzyme R subunit
LYNAATGNQSAAIDVPTPVEAWNLLVESRGLGDRAQQHLQLPLSRRLTNADGSVRQLRYYQRRAIHETLIAMAADQLRILLVMATGSGKTFTALQFVYKLWEYQRRMQFETGERNFRRPLALARDLRNDRRDDLLTRTIKRAHLTRPRRHEHLIRSDPRPRVAGPSRVKGFQRRLRRSR